jgi:amino-acid N-acetyltransferase
MTIRPATAADHAAACALLAQHHLPLDGLPADLAGFVVAEDDTGRLLGLAGLERYDGAALLRSVAVAAAGQGVGAALVECLLDQADAEARPVVLLTTTAEAYFPRFGFVRITREAAPASVHASAEFQGACPASAAVMLRPTL